MNTIERRIARAAKASVEQIRERDVAMCEAAALGIRHDRIAELAGITRSRVSQIVNKAKQKSAA